MEQGGSQEAAACELRLGEVVRKGTPGPRNSVYKGKGCVSCSAAQEPKSHLQGSCGRLPGSPMIYGGGGGCKETSVPEALLFLDQEAAEGQETAKTKKTGGLQLRARKHLLTPGTSCLPPAFFSGPPQLRLHPPSRRHWSEKGVLLTGAGPAHGAPAHSLAQRMLVGA